MIDVLQAVVLGVVQGITAWIPVSSKTQVLLVAHALFSTPFQTAIAFALLLHAGDLVAALVRYRREYAHAVAQLTRPTRVVQFNGSEQARESSFLIISVIATVFVAFIVYLFIVRAIFPLLAGEWLLAAVGVLVLLMAAFTWQAKKKAGMSQSIGLRQALVTGALQGLAVIPGISRSGITQCALLLQGIAPAKAVRLSFLMSAPMIVAAFAGFLLLEGGFAFDPLVALAGIACAAIASWLTMDVLSRIAARIPSHYFLAGVGVLALVPLVVRQLTGVSG